MAPRVNNRQREQILELLTADVPKREIAARVGVTKGQVAAISAHVTMGSYGNTASSRNPQEPSHSSAASTPPSLSAAKPSFVVNRGGVPVAAHLLPPGQQPRARTAIPLGAVVGAESRAWWFPEPSSGAPNPHMVVCGASGFGKTYLLTSLISELAQRGLPALDSRLGALSASHAPALVARSARDSTWERVHQPAYDQG